jgi:hypothetical protein
VPIETLIMPMRYRLLAYDILPMDETILQHLKEPARWRRRSGNR